MAVLLRRRDMEEKGVATDMKDIRISNNAILFWIYLKSKFFLTCDDDFIKRSKRLNLAIRVINPVEYIREVESQ
jgi:hypothetical protein